MAQTLIFKIFNYGTIYFIDKCHIHIQLIEKLICMDTVLEIIPLQGQGNLIGLPDISGLAGPLPVHLVVGMWHVPQITFCWVPWVTWDCPGNPVHLLIYV